MHLLSCPVLPSYTDCAARRQDEAACDEGRTTSSSRHLHDSSSFAQRAIPSAEMNTVDVVIDKRLHTVCLKVCLEGNMLYKDQQGGVVDKVYPSLPTPHAIVLRRGLRRNVNCCPITNLSPSYSPVRRNSRSPVRTSEVRALDQVPENEEDTLGNRTVTEEPLLSPPPIFAMREERENAESERMIQEMISRLYSTGTSRIRDLNLVMHSDDDVKLESIESRMFTNVLP